MPWGVYYKKLRIRNLQKMNSNRCKLVPFLLSVTLTGLDKHTSLLQSPYIMNTECFDSTGPKCQYYKAYLQSLSLVWTNTLAYTRICILRILNVSIVRAPGVAGTAGALQM